MSQTIESISLGGIPNTKSCLWKTLLTAGINKKSHYRKLVQNCAGYPSSGQTQLNNLYNEKEMLRSDRLQ